MKTYMDRYGFSGAEPRTLGGYEIVAGPIVGAMGCLMYAVLNDDGAHPQIHGCKSFPDGRVSKRGPSQYDLVGVEDDD